METNNIARSGTYAGLLLITMATLMFEILMTRIFSVTIWYHFAFMAISIAMFGMTVGSLIVYLRPKFFTGKRVLRYMSLSSLLFAITAVLALVIHINLKVEFQFTLSNVIALGVTYAAISVPFVFSGIAVCLALTRFPRDISSLYAADLVGAALGCILFKFLMDVADGPSAVLAVSALSAIAAVAFSMEGHDMRALRKVSAAIFIIFAFLSFYGAYSASRQEPLFSFKYIKGTERLAQVYEKWNSFSRISLTGDKDKLGKAYAWGPGRNVSMQDFKTRKMILYIDSTAGTDLTNYEGNPETLDFLKFDIVNLVHYIKKKADVFVVGIGGGKDILSAIAFGQKSVTGVEINDNILEALNEVYGDYSGHLDRHPGVTMINDEARSYLARTKGRYDIIQVSLIDTWAATTAGAFILSENSLYTVEAWDLFLKRLDPGGILTFSRWHIGDKPAEIYRLAGLASSALLKNGVANPREHIVIATNRFDASQVMAVATILVSNTPFEKETLDALRDVCGQIGYRILISPDDGDSEELKLITSGREGLEKAVADSVYNIEPTTDDNPFFFNMLRIRDLFNFKDINTGAMRFNTFGIVILGVLLAIVLFLTVIFIIIPLLFSEGRKELKGKSPLLFYFGAIGLGFILVEISLMQRLVIFLGHPTYSLTVVLFSLLVSSGIGSYFTHGIEGGSFRKKALSRLGILLFGLVITEVSLAHLIVSFQASITPVRIAISVLMIMPLGFFMGMAFPLGMKLAAHKAYTLMPWFWGLNGAASVCGSVLAVVIAIEYGIPVSFWTGVASYVVAALSFIAFSSRKHNIPDTSL